MRAFAALLLVACSGGAEAPVEEPVAVEPAPVAAEPEPAAPAAQEASNPAELVDNDALVAHFAGAQVVGGTQPVAWQVEGLQLTLDDGRGPVERTLEFVSPCTVKVKDESQGSSVINVFIRDGDTRYQGLGGGAVQVGEDEWFACAGGKFAWFKGSECTGWKRNVFDRWADDPSVECSRDGDTLHVGSYELNKVGNAFLTTQLAGAEVARHDDFASAQAAVAE